MSETKPTQIARVFLTKTGRGSKVSIDGVEIRRVSRVSVEAVPGAVPQVSVTFLPDQIDVEADADVSLKRAPAPEPEVPSRS